MITVANIWRHPIKSHGREALDAVRLAAHEAMPWDRRWAVTHEATRDDPAVGNWVPCQNFMIGTRTPGLAGIWARLDEDTATVHLRHRDLGELSLRPDLPADAARLVDWIAPLCPPDRARPVGVVSLQGRGWTDTEFPSVTLMNRASNLAVAERLGQPLEEERWRGNFWVDGADAWAEEGWIGRDLRLGGAVVRVREPVVRCLHTAANPVTGARDADTLGALQNGWGHRNFGVYGEVIEGGEVRLGDMLEVL